MKGVELLGVDTSQLSQAQLVLPQFISLEDGRSVLSTKTLDHLRANINEVIWTGKALDCNGLMSLSDIMTKDPKRVEQNEIYLMLSNNIENGDDGDTERQIIVNRLRINFNNKDCDLLTFTDITVYKQLKL